MATIKTATTIKDITSCWEVMSLLRPMLQQNEFIKTIKNLQKEGYTLLYLQDQDKVVSVVGYRIFTMLYCGKMLYIDDLSTLETDRGKGYASILLHHIYEIAQQQQCKTIQLDSGYTRTLAHKLYHKENFNINALHFSKQL